MGRINLNATQLRREAEAKLARASTTTKQQPPAAEKLLHELQVHQIELEMQNEELQRAQIELEKSRDCYVDFYDFAPVGYITLNQEGMIDEINLTGAALLGVERNKLPYHRFASYVATEDRDRWQLHFMSVLTCDDKLFCELALQHDNGTRFNARLDCLRLSKPGKAPVVRVALTDITEIKRVEIELLESKGRLQATLGAIPDLLFEVGLDGRIYDYHSPRTDLLAAPPEAFLGKKFSDVLPPHVVDVLMQALTEAHASGYSVGKQYELQLAHGKFWFELSVARKPATHNQELHFILLARDITGRKAAENELLEMHKLMDEVEHISKLGGWKYDCATGSITWSDEVYRIYGVGKDYDPNDVDRDLEFYFPEDKQTMALAFMKAINDGEPYDLELRFTRSNGERIWVRTIGKPAMVNGKVAGVTGNLIDITEHKLAGQAVRDQEEFFRMIAENVEDFIAVIDLEGRRLYNSPSYAKLFGSVEAIKGADSFAEIHPDDVGRVKQAFWETVQSGRSHRLNYRFVLADGSIHYMESCGGLIRNSQGQALRVVVVSRDITERIKEDEEIRGLAFYDTLTQLPNRRLLNDRLEQAMAASKRSGRYGALMFLDLDNFKPLNDIYGHDAGDLLLVEVARRLASCVREMDTVVRFGGDEFVVMLSELDVDKAKSAKEASIVAEKIRAALSEPYTLKVRHGDKAETTVEHHCTSSIGVVLFIDHEGKAEDIVKWADIAMYQAKEAGSNLVWFDYLKSQPG